MKKCFFAAIILLTVSPLHAGMFNFTLPWDDDSDTITNLSYLNHKPAGVSGYVTAAPDGHLYVNSGASRIKFLAVNVTSSNCFPDKADADKIARRMAKYGINLVRFHLGDASWGQSFIDYAGYADSRHLNAANLDKFDYFVSRLKEHGIYSNINLLAGRDFRSTDGLPASIDTMNWKDKQTPAMFDPVMLGLQMEFASGMLDRTNAYTGIKYTQDPAVVFVETCNEHGLIHAWHNSQMDLLPADFNTQLQVMWNSYLSGKYPSFAALQGAWGMSAPLGDEKLLNGDFALGLNSWNRESTAPASALFSVIANGLAPGKNSCQVNVSASSTVNWHVQLNQGVTLTAGTPYTLSFSAKADRAATVDVIVQEVNGAWQTYFEKTLNLTTDWQRFEFVFAATKTTISARVNFTDMAKETAVYSFADVSFRQGGTIPGTNVDETDFDSVKIFKAADRADRTLAAKNDWVDFLWKKEEHYWGSMNNYIKVSLSAKALTVGTVIGNSTPNLMNLFDVIDAHAYWQHPSYEGEQWVTPWWVNNSSVLSRNDGGTISALSMKRVEGKPFTVTEYNHPFPNSFNAEAYSVLGAYASFQDWDAIYAYTYGDGNTNWSENKLDGFFDVDMDPGKWANMLHAALMFRRNDISAASAKVTVPITTAQELGLLTGAGPWRLIDAQDAGMPLAASLMHGTSIIVQGGVNPAGALSPADITIPGAGIYTSDTNQLNWNSSAGVLKIDSPKTKGVIGNNIGAEYNLSGVIIRPLSAMQNWSSIMMSVAQGGTFASGAEKIFVTASGFSSNTGVNYRLYPSGASAGFPPAANADINTASFGTGPTTTEGIGAEFVLPYAAANVKVYSLDNTGVRVLSLPISDEGGNAKFQISDTRGAIWYEIEIYPGPAPTDTFTLTPTVTRTPGGPTETVTPTVTLTVTVGAWIIDNCEDGNNANMLGGYWYDYADALSTINPPKASVFTMTSGGADTPLYSARIYGSVAAQPSPDVYPSAGLGVNLYADSGAPVYHEEDVNGFTGIRFYVKGDGMQYTIRLPYISNLDGSTLTGYNDYKYTFAAPADWTLLEIPFSSFTQDTGWGTQYPRSTVLAHVSAVQWQVLGYDRAFDLYIDDVEFYNAPPPPSPTPTITLTATPTLYLSKTATVTVSVTSTITVTLTAVIPSHTITATVTTTPLPAMQAADNLDGVYIYPSVYDGTNGQKGIVFAKLTRNSEIQIYNLRGELVHSARADSPDGTYLWKLEGRRKNSKIAPGIYIYVIKADDEEIKHGKLAIVK
ncbi:MAG: CIA30 family protein [Candidatus Goldbacteria bacterium]|nr:CIA30 family protein [Candidatus Goldiibacteriota bacterium]